MKAKIFVVKLIKGMHAKPAALFVHETSRFKSAITVAKDGVEVNGKSIMGLMLLGAECGSSLKISINGPDEKEALEALNRLFAGTFEDDDRH